MALSERMEWTRRRYHVEDGYVRPSRISPPETYDPFERYAKGEYLHLALMELDSSDADAVAEFATRWGPLGILHEFLIEARYVEVQPGLVSVEPDDTGPHVIASPTGRVTGTSAEFHPTPTVLMARITAEESPREVPLGDYYASFFPNSPDGPFPAFGTSLLWDEMCEPMELIEQEVQLFNVAVSLMELPADQIDPEDPIDGLALLQHRLTRVSPTPRLVEGKWRMHWRFPSLISVAYYMVYKDLAGGRMIRECAAHDCTKNYIANASTDRKWCSPKCANRINMQISRAAENSD